VSPFADDELRLSAERIPPTRSLLSSCDPEHARPRRCLRGRHDHASASSDRRDRRSLRSIRRWLHAGEPRRIARNDYRHHRKHSVVFDNDDHQSTLAVGQTNSELSTAFSGSGAGAAHGGLVRGGRLRVGRQQPTRRLRLLRIYEIRVREIPRHASQNGARAGARRKRGLSQFRVVAAG